MDTNNVINSTAGDDGKEKPANTSAPNESTGIYVRGFVKITDPESGEILVQTAN